MCVCVCVCYSCWVRPSVSAAGDIVVSLTSDTSSILYSLSLISDANNFLVMFNYRQSLMGVSLGVGVVDIPVAKSMLSDDSYHSLAMVVTGDRMLLYVDGQFQDSR